MKNNKYYRASYKEPEWFTREGDRLFEQYEKSNPAEEDDFETFVRKNASPEYIKELNYALSVL